MSAQKERMLGIECWQFWPTFHWSRASLFIYFLGCSLLGEFEESNEQFQQMNKKCSKIQIFKNG
jgi:hypothetical protein